MKQSILWSLGMGNVPFIPIEARRKKEKTNNRPKECYRIWWFFVHPPSILFVLYHMFNITQSHNIFFWMSDVQCPIYPMFKWIFRFVSVWNLFFYDNGMWARVRALYLQHSIITLKLLFVCLSYCFFPTFVCIVCSLKCVCVIRQCMSPYSMRNTNPFVYDWYITLICSKFKCISLCKRILLPFYRPFQLVINLVSILFCHHHSACSTK